MMKRCAKNSLKNLLKGKAKLTLSALMPLLITGSIGYAANVDKTVEITLNASGQIVVAPEAGVLEGDTWTNADTINVTGGNGLQIKGSNENFKIVNKGIISASTDSASSSGNGIYLYERNVTIDKIINTGIISGSSYNIQVAGNGIYLEKYTETGTTGTISKITNNGIISGTSNSGYHSGNGIYITSNQDIEITNTGIISGNNNDNDFSGNGLFYKPTYNTAILTAKVINTGIISGTSNGISGNINFLINSGVISGSKYGYNYRSGNGIFVNTTSKFTTVKNSGIISGSYSYDNSNINRESGNGLFADIDAIKMTNCGLISGQSKYKHSSTGNGIYTYMSNMNISNYGMITGNGTSHSGNGIYFGQQSNAKLLNYGIIAGSNEAINEYSASYEVKNHGLLIDGAGTTNMKITAGVGGEQKVITEFNDDGTAKATENKFIINGVTDIQDNGTATAASINSSNLKDKITDGKLLDGKLEDYIANDSENGYKNLIINVVGDTATAFNVNNDLTLSNSVINGYKDAVVLNGGTFTGNDVIVNAEENAFLGSANDDELTLTGNSIINGKTDLGAGNDSLAIADTVQINSTLDGGAGNADKLSFTSSAKDGKINVLHNISNFENININTNVTLFENVKVMEPKISPLKKIAISF